MRRHGVVAVLTGLVASCALMAGPASAVETGDDGCTPGYWKNHTENWLEAPNVAIDPNMLLTATYQGNPGFAVTSALSGDSFLDALSYKGGPGAAGGERILMRAAVAAWLNAAHEGLGYPYRRWTQFNIVGQVNDAIASGDRATMLALATLLDDTNNSDCPLN